jgi:hypothetical protein
MKLGDGTIRKLSPKDVKEVTYGGSAAPPPAPVPVVAQPAPVAALPPMGMAPNMGMAPTMVMTPNGYVMVAPRQPLRRQSGGLYATGLVFVILGSIMLPVGGVAVAGGAANGQCQHDSTAPCGAGAALLIGGSIFLGSGIAMAVVGGHRVPDDGSALQKASPWWRPTDVAVSPTGSRLTWQF